MGSIKHHPRVPICAAQHTQVSEQLQQLFAARLQSERIHFVTLSAALARAEESPSSIFDDLNFRAHRLKGAAATFSYPDVATAAGTLEKASQRAAGTHAPHTDSPVWDALVTLVQILGAFDEAPAAL